MLRCFSSLLIIALVRCSSQSLLDIAQLVKASWLSENFSKQSSALMHNIIMIMIDGHFDEKDERF